MRGRHALIAVAVLSAMSGLLVGCSQPATNTTPKAGVQSEEASESDALESTTEENVESRQSEEASEGDAQESKTEENVENSTKP